MLKLKNCPRCGGDVLIDRDYHGSYEECIQCGYHRDLQTPVRRKAAPGEVCQNAAGWRGPARR